MRDAMQDYTRCFGGRLQIWRPYLLHIDRRGKLKWEHQDELAILRPSKIKSLCSFQGPTSEGLDVEADFSEGFRVGAASFAGFSEGLDVEADFSEGFRVGAASFAGFSEGLDVKGDWAPTHKHQTSSRNPTCTVLMGGAELKEWWNV